MSIIPKQLAKYPLSREITSTLNKEERALLPSKISQGIGAFKVKELKDLAME